MKTKKLLSLLLALMMMLSVVPMYASAAEPIALTASNITTFPTVSGTIYYGQTVGEALTLIGGEVQYNGEVVPGEFVHTNPSERPTGGGTVAMRASFTFNPADTENYTGFSVRYSRDVTYMVLPTTPIYVDENSKPYIENTEVEAGTKLSDISIIGSAVKNPYYSEESRFLPKTWTWANPDTIVEKSGYFDVVLKGDNKNYNNLTHSIYINIAGSIIVPIIDVSEVVLDYDKDRTGKDLNFDCAKAYVANDDGSTTQISGAFSVPDNAKDVVLSVGKYDMPAIFTPTDTEKYATVEFTVPVTVNKGQMKFVDENGNEIVPEITVPYGTTFGDIHYYLESYVAGDDAVSIGMVGIENANNTRCETGTYTASLINRTDSNYERTEKEFKIIVEAKKLEPTVKSDTKGYYVVDDSGTYKVQGTFDVYIDGELYKSGVKYLEKVAYVPETSGTHEIKFVYKPVENDNFAIENEIKDTFAINLVHKLTSSDNVGTFGDFRNGTAIKLVANIAAENFAGWKVTNAAGEEVDLGLDNTSVKATITMPDYDIHVEALEKNASSGGSGGIFDMDFGDLSEGDSEWAIINIIRNIIAMFKSFLQQLIETFQSIGD